MEKVRRHLKVPTDKKNINTASEAINKFLKMEKNMT